MASSATLTTTHLPILRASLEEWRQKQPAATPFTSPLQDISARLTEGKPEGEEPAKDIVVAFRTRPPLPNEAADKFHASEGEDDAVGEGEEAAEAPKVEFCSGVTARSAEPGVFVAHVPGWKVCGAPLLRTYR